MAFSPFKFLQEVRSETAKVTWPTRRETTITTIMVFVMVALASVFLFRLGSNHPFISSPSCWVSTDEHRNSNDG